jgi:hypothetical protein
VYESAPGHSLLLYQKDEMNAPIAGNPYTKFYGLNLMARIPESMYRSPDVARAQAVLA